MSKIIQMAGTAQSLCRAWHALHTLEARSRPLADRAPHYSPRKSGAAALRRVPDNNT